MVNEQLPHGKRNERSNAVFDRLFAYAFTLLPAVLLPLSLLFAFEDNNRAAERQRKQYQHRRKAPLPCFWNGVLLRLRLAFRLGLFFGKLFQNRLGL